MFGSGIVSVRPPGRSSMTRELERGQRKVINLHSTRSPDILSVGTWVQKGLLRSGKMTTLGGPNVLVTYVCIQ